MGMERVREPVDVGLRLATMFRQEMTPRQQIKVLERMDEFDRLVLVYWLAIYEVYHFGDRAPKR